MCVLKDGEARRGKIRGAGKQIPPVSTLSIPNPTSYLHTNEGKRTIRGCGGAGASSVPTLYIFLEADTGASELQNRPQRMTLRTKARDSKIDRGPEQRDRTYPVVRCSNCMTQRRPERSKNAAFQQRSRSSQTSVVAQSCHRSVSDNPLYVQSVYNLLLLVSFCPTTFIFARPLLRHTLPPFTDVTNRTSCGTVSTNAWNTRR